jgi:hypothetical protein
LAEDISELEKDTSFPARAYPKIIILYRHNQRREKREGKMWLKLNIAMWVPDYYSINYRFEQRQTTPTRALCHNSHGRRSPSLESKTETHSA